MTRYREILRLWDQGISKSSIAKSCECSRNTVSHIQLYGHPGQYSTVVEHMPPNHQKFIEWDGDRFRKWARSIGVHTEAVVTAILGSHKVEQQGYRACMGLLKLADKYSVSRLETACGRALSYTQNPGYKSIQTILKTGSDKLVEETTPSPTTSEHGFVRGAAYYGGKRP